MDKLILRFFIKYRIHIIVWLSFITYETIVVGLVSGGFSKLGTYVIHYSLNVLLFYFHAHFVLRYILKSKVVFLLLPLGIAIEVMAYTFLYYLLENTAANFPAIFGIDPIVLDRSLIIKITWRSLYFIGFSTGYYFLITLLAEKERIAILEKLQLTQVIQQQKMERDLTKAQNAYLRAQINPHFLFNTLNFIYNKTRKTAPVAADAILTLAAMMRYAVETSEEKGHIHIGEEVEQVHNLIHLHKLRQNHQIYFDVQVQDDTLKLNIIPLILITLVENIFKHGNLSLIHHPAFIKIYTSEDVLHIETDNLINTIHNASGLNKGLENIEKRLNNIYFEGASFVYETTVHNHFKAHVMIKVKALSFLTLPPDTSENVDK